MNCLFTHIKSWLLLIKGLLVIKLLVKSRHGPCLLGQISCQIMSTQNQWVSPWISVLYQHLFITMSILTKYNFNDGSYVHKEQLLKKVFTCGFISQWFSTATVKQAALTSSVTFVGNRTKKKKKRKVQNAFLRLVSSGLIRQRWGALLLRHNKASDML